MLELLNIRIGFINRKSHANEEGKFPIILRVTYRDQRRDSFTGLYCDRDDWDVRNGRVYFTKSTIGINRNLEVIHRKALDAFDKLKFAGEPFTIDELMNLIKGKEEKPVLLIDYLEEQTARQKKRMHVDISAATYDKYRRSASHMLQFLQKEFKVRNYPLIRMDKGFLEKYFQFLRSTRNIAHNSAVKYVVFLKTILMPAFRAGVFKIDPFKELKLKQKPVYKGYLTQEEINQLSAVELSSRDLSRIRDIFLFSCYTGLAYIDLKQLDKTHIMKTGESTFAIRKPRQKTGQESIIPLLPAAIRILQKYSLTSDFRNFSWSISANQNMNVHLKTIGKLAGITKELHMHLARHTFATTVTLSNGVPIETVSAMLGHSNLKQTLHYAKIITSKYQFDMDKISGLYK
jgi:site-specific recombinase XerD